MTWFVCVLQITARLADNALAAFIKVIVDVYNANIDGVLEPFVQHPEIIKRFVEGWLVQIGFGLHIGSSNTVVGSVLLCLLDMFVCW